jgi:hypothetical protein
MTSAWSNVLPVDGHNLFDRTIGETLAHIVRRVHPRDTAKHVARRWELDATTAVNVTKGHASERTITKALKAEGWPLFMALGEAVTGQTYPAFLQSAIEENDRVRARQQAHKSRVALLESRAGIRGLERGPDDRADR